MAEDNSKITSSSNADYKWDAFDPEVYFQQYYGEPHPDDHRITRLAAEALKHAKPDGNGLDVVDVGTGPNLIPFFTALPRVRSLTTWEFAEVNLTWLAAELARQEMRPQWRDFWRTTREAYGNGWDLPDDPTGLLREKCVLRQGSIFDLPARTWDAATMFFCAESITRRQDEFEAACAAFAGCVRPGGTLAAAFLVKSEGYVVADQAFPAIKVSPEAIEGVFMALASEVKSEPIGLVDREIASGYSGALFITAVAC